MLKVAGGVSGGNGTVTNIATGTGLTGGPITSSGTISLANTTVTAASYGNASTVGSFTVDAQGRLTSASNSTISIAPSQINATIPNTGLTNSSVTINGTAISLGGSGTVTANTTGTLTLGTGLTGTSFNGSANVTANLANTTVTAGSYGNANTVSAITVNAQGQITAASNTAISITNSQVTGLGTMSTQNANAVVITGGTIDNVTLGASTANTISYTTAVGSTSETVPLLIGGTTASSNLTIQSTSGAGTTDNIVFKTGSQVAAMTVGTTQNILIGTGAVNAARSLSVSKNTTGATTAYGILQNGSIQSDVTVSAINYYSNPSTQAASFTLATLAHFQVTQGTIGSGSTVTTQIGYYSTATLTGATNNYGFYSNLASATGRWNFYASGTAANYMAGILTVNGGTATPAGGSTTAYLQFGTTAGFGIYYGSGAPTISAPQGSMYIRSDGSSTLTRMYINTNGSTTWTNVVTGA